MVDVVYVLIVLGSWFFCICIGLLNFWLPFVVMVWWDLFAVCWFLCLADVFSRACFGVEFWILVVWCLLLGLLCGVLWLGSCFSVRPVCFGLSFGVAVRSFGWYLFVCLLRWVCFVFIGWVGCFCGCA